MRMAVVRACYCRRRRCGPRSSPARAEVRILASPGGQVGPFLDLFDRVRESGERVVIDGPCLSACTLVLSTVPSERICVTRRAVLGFHAARSIDRRGRMYAEPEASQAVLRGVPGAGARLDQPPRRIDVAAVAVARARTRRDLSEVQVELDFVGWAKARLRRAHRSSSQKRKAEPVSVANWRDAFR